MIRLVLAFALLLGVVYEAHAADPREIGARSLIITYKVAPADRPAFRHIMATEGRALLDRQQAAGRLAGYTLLWSRYADELNWDMLLAARFDDKATLGLWRELEKEATAALPQAALTLVKSVSSAPSDLIRTERRADPRGAPPVYLIITYDYLIGTNDYIAYLDGYTIPQILGWMDAKVVSGYGLYLPRFAAARPWSSLLWLEYRGDEGLGLRDVTTERVRAKLRSVPQWKAWSDKKENVRETRGYVVADELTAP